MWRPGVIRPIMIGAVASAIAVMAVALQVAIAAASAGAGARGLPTAHAARTLDGTDTAHLRLVRQHESTLFEEGSAAGALPGHMRATLSVGSRFTGACTIYTAYGAIAGRGSATAHGTGRYQSFSGSFTITAGSGRYRHVYGATRLYGTFDRRTFAVVVQTVGRLSY